MNYSKFFLYLLVMAGVTYLVRMLPMVLLKKKITNKFVLSVLFYMPYAVLACMIFPGFLYATGDIRSAVCGFIVAFILGWKKSSLIAVAAGASGGALVCELVIKYIIK